MAGMRVEVVACRPNGDVDVDDLRAKIADHAERLAAIMITYPSTHGVYEHEISDICAAVHDAGGQVRSEEHTSELQSLMRISYAVFCLKKKKKKYTRDITTTHSVSQNTKYNKT